MPFPVIAYGGADGGCQNDKMKKQLLLHSRDDGPNNTRARVEHEKKKHAPLLWRANKNRSREFQPAARQTALNGSLNVENTFHGYKSCLGF